MHNKKLQIIIGLILVLVLILPAISQAQRRQLPPEYNEYRKTMLIKDLEARIKELERLVKAYPDSQYQTTFNNAITDARIGLCTDVDAIVELQNPFLNSFKGLNQIYMYFFSTQSIVEHRNLAGFDKKKVVRAVEELAERGLKIADDPEFVQSVPEQQRSYIQRYAPMMLVSVAKAHLIGGNTKTVFKALDDYLKRGGVKDKEYHYVLASAQEKSGEVEEAFGHFFSAAAENHKDAVERAKSLYTQINGSLEGFDKKLEAKQRELPYHPEHFQAAKNWQGKAVLVELFTGSECPPCTAADLGFDGLIEAVDSKYVAVLEYHLPIPRPDPIMNHATKLRQVYYGIRSTPTTLFDGEKKHAGGGSRARGELKYNQYAGEVKALGATVPDVKLEVNASLSGDEVKIRFTADKVLSDADYNIALVQKEEVYKGSNGIVYHKNVVREFVTTEAAKSGTVVINLIDSEKAAEKHLVDYEETGNFQFKEKHFKIDRSQLQVIFFVQNKSDKKVLNAAVTDVSK